MGARFDAGYIVHTDGGVLRGISSQRFVRLYKLAENEKKTDGVIQKIGIQKDAYLLFFVIFNKQIIWSTFKNVTYSFQIFKLDSFSFVFHYLFKILIA